MRTSNHKNNRQTVPCFTRNLLLYNLSGDVVLSGLAHLMAIGWPSCVAPAGMISDNEARGLAGDSFSVPLASIMGGCMAMNVFAPWHQ